MFINSFCLGVGYGELQGSDLEQGMIIIIIY